MVSDNATFLLESFPLSLPILLVACMHRYICGAQSRPDTNDTVIKYITSGAGESR